MYAVVKRKQINTVVCFCVLFDRVSGEKPSTDLQTTDLDDFRKALDNNACFDPVRNTEAFRALYE